MSSKLEKLAAEQVAAEDAVKAAEQAVKDSKDALTKKQDQFAEAMVDEGFLDFTLSSGEKVKLGKDFRVTFKSERGAAVDWLVNNGYRDILRSVVSVSLALGTDTTALKEAINALGLPCEEKVDCHWATLTSLMKELVEEGGDFPRELFNVLDRVVPKIRRKKEE